MAQNEKLRFLIEKEDLVTTSEDENGQASSAKIPVFVTPSASTHWTRLTWGDIKTECRDLINAVEVTMQDTLLSTHVYSNLQELKRTLQTAMRRRNRIPDEVWFCFRALQRAHEDVLNANFIVSPERRAQSASSILPDTPIQSVITVHNAHIQLTGPARPGGSTVSFDGDVPPNLPDQPESSCLDILSSTLIRCGIELELYDEETNGINRIAGVGLGIAVFVAICTVVYYF